MVNSKITDVTTNFDNIYRITTDTIILDVYSKITPKVGDYFKWEIGSNTFKNSMNGKVYKKGAALYYVSFGGMLGMFLLPEYSFNEFDEFNISYEICN